MFKKLSKALCMVLCLAMLIPYSVFAEGPEEISLGFPDPSEVTHHIDITDGSWYAEACRYAYWNGYMIGVSENEFLPHAIMTREMAVVAIIRSTCYEDFVVPEYSTSYFEDVQPGHWYSDYIQLAYENGLTAGIGNKEFGLGKAITREDFLVMLYSVVKSASPSYWYQGIRYSQSGLEEASSYAQEAFSCFKSRQYMDLSKDYDQTIWAPIPPVISGCPDGSYHLQDTLTRAEVAMFLYIYMYYPRHNYVKTQVK